MTAAKGFVDCLRAFRKHEGLAGPAMSNFVHVTGTVAWAGKGYSDFQPLRTSNSDLDAGIRVDRKSVRLFRNKSRHWFSVRSISGIQAAVEKKDKQHQRPNQGPHCTQD